MALNADKLQRFVDRAVQDLGAAQSAALVVIGDQLGLYKAMAGAGPITPADLAARTGTIERHVREWLVNQAAGGYVEYDPATECYRLSDEHAEALAVENSPAFLPNAFQAVLGAPQSLAQVKEAFQVERPTTETAAPDGLSSLFRPGYQANLVAQWLPALDGVVAKLTSGARVADVACGVGAATLQMAAAFPQARFLGFDVHEASIDDAKKSARRAGVSGNVYFQFGSAADFPGWDFDLVTFFDCLHRLANPQAAARRVRSALTPEGTWMIVEPRAGDRVAGTLNPVGYPSASQAAPPPGAVAGEKRIRELAETAGFSRVRRVAETPFNVVYEVRI